jgi:hypothetical protein
MNHFRSYLNRSGRGQSLVEFTILLPVLLMMMSGLIEFGFLLNSYLDIIDAAREAARFAANDDPTVGAPTDPYVPPTQVNFWHRAFLNSRSSLFTASDGRINWNTNDPKDCAGVNGDIVVSAFALVGDTLVQRYPAFNDGASNVEACVPPGTGYLSKITDARVMGDLSGSAFPSGFVLIEIYYEYEMLLGLPWITAFVPDPIVLYAYTIMPNTYVEPTP